MEVTVENHGFLFTSESVSEGHPDKIADQISDAVLDAVLADDPKGHVACETLITTGLVVVSGRDHHLHLRGRAVAGAQHHRAHRLHPRQVRFRRRDVRRHHRPSTSSRPTSPRACRRRSRCRVDPSDVDTLDCQGAGDQGMMFGYACRDTEELMPMPILLAHRLVHRMSEVRKGCVLPVSAARRQEPGDGAVRRTASRSSSPRSSLSTQHQDGIDIDTLMRPDLIEHVIKPVLPEGLYDPEFKKTKLYVNPTGKFVIGGPMGDTGLTGRKIIVDTYGGFGRHGGGAFSGKDPSKVDRSAAYAARYVAKNIVAAGLADRCEVEIAYAIGVAHPVSVMVDCFGTEQVDPALIEELVRSTSTCVRRPSSAT